MDTPTLTCRLLPFEVADGPTNMATDEALLQAAACGIASLRFYGWSPATLSLGYFQSEQLRQRDPLLAGLPFVRRPSGGDTLVHHHEVTYALALPRGQWQLGQRWLKRMHEIIKSALWTLGVQAIIQDCTIAAQPGSLLCFHHFTCCDLLVAGCKVVGSAQRKQRGALLQHGGILLAQSPYTPTLPGIAELTGRILSPSMVVNPIRSAFIQGTAATLVEQPLTASEIEMVLRLKCDKYLNATWNCKR